MAARSMPGLCWAVWMAGRLPLGRPGKSQGGLDPALSIPSPPVVARCRHFLPPCRRRVRVMGMKDVISAARQPSTNQSYPPILDRNVTIHNFPSITNRPRRASPPDRRPAATHDDDSSAGKHDDDDDDEAIDRLRRQRQRPWNQQLASQLASQAGSSGGDRSEGA
jgi:hypothetical protein